MIARQTWRGRRRGGKRARIGLALLVALAALWPAAVSRVHVNASWSDEAWGYLLLPLLGAAPEVGDRVLFEPPEVAGSPVPYLKTVRGVPGMAVTVDADGTVFLDGVAVGRAKSHALDGRRLRPLRPESSQRGITTCTRTIPTATTAAMPRSVLAPRSRILGRAIAMPDIPWLGLNGPLVGPEDVAPGTRAEARR